MTRTYTATQNPGDTRTRARYIGISNYHNPDPQNPTIAPHANFLEQVVIRTADGVEAVLEDTNGFSKTMDEAALAEVHPILNPATEAPFSQAELDGIAALIASGLVTPAITQALLYSNTRQWQTERDAAEAAE